MIFSHSRVAQSSCTRPPVSPLLRFQHQKNLHNEALCEWSGWLRKLHNCIESVTLHRATRAEPAQMVKP